MRETPSNPNQGSGRVGALERALPPWRRVHYCNPNGMSGEDSRRRYLTVSYRDCNGDTVCHTVATRALAAREKSVFSLGHTTPPISSEN